MFPQWFYIFQAALHTLAALSPTVISAFKGGAHDTATKVGSALAVVDSITTQLSHNPVTEESQPSVSTDILHPELLEHAQAIAAEAGEPDPKAEA